MNARQLFLLVVLGAAALQSVVAHESSWDEDKSVCDGCKESKCEDCEPQGCAEGTVEYKRKGDYCWSRTKCNETCASCYGNDCNQTCADEGTNYYSIQVCKYKTWRFPDYKEKYHGKGEDSGKYQTPCDNCGCGKFAKDKIPNWQARGIVWEGEHSWYYDYHNTEPSRCRVKAQCSEECDAEKVIFECVNGTWIPDDQYNPDTCYAAPVCEHADENADIEIVTDDEGSQTAHVECEPGYQVSEGVCEQCAVCDNDNCEDPAFGWQPELKQCEPIACPLPSLPDNVEAPAGGPFNVFDFAVYPCKDGYYVEGEAQSVMSQNIQCQPQAPCSYKWQLKKCVQKTCPYPEVPGTDCDGGANSPNGTEIVCKCLDDKATESFGCEQPAICVDGAYVFPLGGPEPCNLEPVCPIPSALELAMLAVQNNFGDAIYRVGDIVQINCTENFTLADDESNPQSQEVTCEVNPGNCSGFWNISACEFEFINQDICDPEPLNVSDLNAEFEVTENQTSAVVVCLPGYKVNGTDDECVQYLNCTKDGKDGFWDPAPQACVRIECDDFSVPDNTEILDGPTDGNYVDSEITLGCAPDCERNGKIDEEQYVKCEQRPETCAARWSEASECTPIPTTTTIKKTPKPTVCDVCEDPYEVIKDLAGKALPAYIKPRLLTPEEECKQIGFYCPCGMKPAIYEKSLTGEFERIASDSCSALDMVCDGCGSHQEKWVFNLYTCDKKISKIPYHAFKYKYRYRCVNCNGCNCKKCGGLCDH